MFDKQDTLKRYRFKIFFIGLLFGLFFCVIILRAFQLQIRDNSRLDHLAKSQYQTRVYITPRRGAIYDRHGNVLAQDVLVASVGIHPDQIRDKEAALEVLRKHTGLSKSAIRAKLNSKKKFEWIERRIPFNAGQALEEMQLKGVQVVREYRRFYPNKHLAGQLLGAVGYDAQALGGLELSYDKYLMSASQKKYVKRDARGRFVSFLDNTNRYHDVYLTIDKNIQHMAEKFLWESAGKHEAGSAFLVVSDVTNGEILAMANYPPFNPNLYWKYPQKIWKNSAVTDLYEPGSTFKTILLGAALDSGLVRPGSRFYCENGQYRVQNKNIRDHHPYGWLSAADILKVSSNIGVTKIAQKLGPKIFYGYIQKFGFHEGVGADFLGASAGLIRPYQQWHDIDSSNIAFGQGISVNGLHMVSAYTAIAGGGWLFRPQLVKKVVDWRGQAVIEAEGKPVRQVISPETSKQLQNMLYSVTQEGGTGRSAYIDGYLAAGKTGTAQKFDPQAKSYDEDDYISSFIGFAPLKSPRIVVYAVYDSPRKHGYYGGTVAAPVFKSVTEQTLKYLGVVPDGKSFAQTDGPFAGQKDADGLNIRQVNEVREMLDEGNAPDLKGLSMRQVLELLGNDQVKTEISGSGRVVEQAPQPGQKLQKGQKLRVKLAQQS